VRQHRILIGASVPICLLLAAAVGLAYAQGPEPPPPSAQQAPLGTVFTYQGQLKLDGEPVNDECELAFRLYDHATDDSQVGGPITETVVISDGLFTQPLDFGAAAFSGDARWLGIQVQCPGDASFADLGRQELTAAPYAQFAGSTGALHGQPVTTTAPAVGQVLEWDGAVWGPAVDDDTTVFAGPGLGSSGDSSAVTLTVSFSGTGTLDYVARSNHHHDGAYSPVGHTHPGSDITSAVPTATYALQADTAAIASDVETGVITPTHLNGITDNGANGQVLASDGSGGFAWQTPAADAVRRLVQDFVVASGENISAGDVVSFLDGEICRPGEYWGPESVFNAGGTLDIAVVSLSGTDFVVAYRDSSHSDYGTAITGTVSGGTLSWGAESVFNADETRSIVVTSLSTTDFVVAYADHGNSAYGTVITGTVSGGTLSWGSESVFNNGSTAYLAVTSLSATDFVVAYRDWDNSQYGTAITGTVSGGSLSWGSESVFNNGSTDYIAVTDLSGTDFVVAYRDFGNSSYGTAITGTVSGGTLSWGPESVFYAAYTDGIAVTNLSATDFVVAYRDVGNSYSYYGTAIVGTVSGGSLSWGPASVFNAARIIDSAVTSLSPTDIVVAYTDDGNSEYGTTIVGTVSGGSLSWGSESVFNAARTVDIAVVGLSPTDFVVAYRDGGNSYRGTAIVRNLRWQLIGTARTSGSGGETVPVIISGVSDAHSGLVPGQMVYLQEDGSLGLTPTEDRVGLAISETEMILDQMW
jgi:hypothetical protein